MATFGNANAGLVSKGWTGVVQRFGALGQVYQHIQLGQRSGAHLKVSQMRHQDVEQLVIQLFLQRQRFTFRREHFVFVLFQLGNNVAANVVNRCQVALPTTDLDIVTVYGVVADFQGVEPQTFTLADFQLIQIIRRAIGQRTPFVQLFVITRSNNPAIPHQNRRRINDGAFQQFAKLGKFAHGFAQLLHWRAVDLSQLSAQFRQLLESVTHTGEIAWTRGTQCQARQDTLKITHLTQHRLQFGVTILQCGNGLLTANQRFGVADRHMQPAFEHTAAHGGNRAVKNRRQRIFHAASEVLRDLQVAARGGIHDDAVLLTLHGN